MSYVSDNLKSIPYAYWSLTRSSFVRLVTSVRQRQKLGGNHGWHWSGKSQGNSRSGNFVLGQGNLRF